MATRIKAPKQALIGIANWTEADQLVKELGEIQRKLTAAADQSTKDTEVIKQWLADQTKPLNERQKHITKSLEAFAEAHKGDFGDARSRKLDFGLVGWRKSTAIEIAATTLEYIKKLFTPAKQKTVINTKETVDKEALAKLTDDELATIMARRKPKDVFFVEPLITEAADKTA